MTKVYMNPSPQAASAIIRVRARMSNQERADNPLTLNQAEILARFGKCPDYHVLSLRILLARLGGPLPIEHEEAMNFLEAAGTVLFEHVLPTYPETEHLQRFVNCAYRHGSSDWHERAVVAFRARSQPEQMAKAA